ncbi:hypothetical protein EDB81DRAFT_10231 [Dactylonectria macrodidyma]|uniref:Uncharacterized protein n=1 Tax=Dactylonectria macrodidyma TaxID=307937 RepID=A0A9P9JQP8_9HYPO|nr:hypothetical protein EDB81DRAFT_10231 [Dactylonectria macrodidyma]
MNLFFLFLLGRWGRRSGSDTRRRVFQLKGANSGEYWRWTLGGKFPGGRASRGLIREKKRRHKRSGRAKKAKKSAERCGRTHRGGFFDKKVAVEGRRGQGEEEKKGRRPR